MPGGTTVPRETGLTELQRRILEALADLEPPWTLTGGAALAIARLRDLGFEVEPVHGADTFERLRVSQGSDTVVVDLVAEPVDAIESPESVSVGSARIRIDTPHEILVNKLCALLHRSELRDLIDVRALLAGGGDLIRALGDAPRKDGGFSPLTLAWILEGLQIRPMGEASGLSEDEVTSLESYRQELVREITKVTDPGSS